MCVVRHWYIRGSAQSQSPMRATNHAVSSSWRIENFKPGELFCGVMATCKTTRLIISLDNNQSAPWRHRHSMHFPNLDSERSVRRDQVLRSTAVSFNYGGNDVFFTAVVYKSAERRQALPLRARLGREFVASRSFSGSITRLCWRHGALSRGRVCQISAPDVGQQPIELL